MSPSLARHLDALMGFPRVSGDEPRPTVPALTFTDVFPA